MSCALLLCKVLPCTSVSNLSFPLGGSFMSVMDKDQQILGHGLAGTIIPIW